jgi:nitrate reductase beta subunit
MLDNLKCTGINFFCHIFILTLRGLKSIYMNLRYKWYIPPWDQIRTVLSDDPDTITSSLYVTQYCKQNYNIWKHHIFVNLLTWKKYVQILDKLKKVIDMRFYCRISMFHEITSMLELLSMNIKGHENLMKAEKSWSKYL